MLAVPSSRLVTSIVAVAVAIGSSSYSSRAAGPHAPDSRAAQILRDYANLPGAFVENRGQTDPRVRYYAQGPRHAFYLTRDELILSFMDEAAARRLALALRFPGSNPRRTLEAEQRVTGEVNYFHGNDPAGWRTGIPRYAQIAYRELWPGVDLRLREQTGTLKYEFRVRAGARPADIRLAYAGATGLSLDESGALLIETGLGTLRDSPPVSYQVIDGVRVPIDSRYVLIDSTADAAQYGFAFGADTGRITS
jgi:hypothetical protein